MKRRVFFNRLLGAGAASVIITPALVSAEPKIHEFRANIPSYAYWSGWKEPANQLIVFGHWHAIVPDDERGRDILLATTLGGVGRYRELEMLNLTVCEGWPILSPKSDPNLMQEVRFRALQNLIRAVERGL